MKLKVTSSHEIAGVKKGGFVDTSDKDLAHIDFEALIEGGHLEKAKTNKEDRKSVVQGKSVDLGGGGIIKKKKRTEQNI